MSQENADLLRQMFSAYNAAFLTGDTSTFVDLAAPEVEWHSATEVLDPLYRGRDGLRRWMTEFFESWDALRVEPEEFVHVDPDRILVAIRLRGTGKGSGVDTDMLMYELMTIREGKLSSVGPFGADLTHSKRRPVGVGPLPLSTRARPTCACSWGCTPGRSRLLRLSDTAGAMSQENVEIVRRFEDSWARRDLDAALTCVGPDFEFDWSNSMGPFVGTYRGHDGLTRFWAELLDAWEEFAPEAEEIIECPPARLITLDVVRARGKGSGIDMEARGAMLWTVQEGKIVRVKMFQNKDEALAAVRLSE